MENLNSKNIENKIFFVRGQRIMIDYDLANLYGVKTKVLKQAVKRNIARFPEDFMFELTDDEQKELVTNCDRLRSSLKHSVIAIMAFTEHGVIMLSSILKSERAIEINIQITRAFVKLRQLANNQKEIALKLKELEKAVKENSNSIFLIFKTIDSMLQYKVENKPKIGFKPDVSDD